MASKTKNPVEEETPVIPKRSIIPARPRLPDPATVTPLRKIAGTNPQPTNLKDHPELDGRVIVINDCKVNPEGEYGPFCILDVWLLPKEKKAEDLAKMKATDFTEEDHTVIITGAGNLYSRVTLALSEDALPISGTLRKSGRAWFLD
jgi:hypothetical protein